MCQTRLGLLGALAILPIVVLSGCTRVEPVIAKPPTTVSYIRGMSLPNDADAQVTFDTGKVRGTITIQKGVTVGYKNVTTTSSEPDVPTSSKTTLTVKGHALVIEEDRVMLGDTALGPLAGEVRIEIRSDGIFVDGVKKADLGP